MIKWSNYEFAARDGFQYVRIKHNFVISNTPSFTLALVQSDDEAIGILLAIPSTLRVGSEVEPSATASILQNELYWKEIRAAAATMKKDETVVYKELWVPGFLTETRDSPTVHRLCGRQLCNRTIIAVPILFSHFHTGGRGRTLQCVLS